MSHAVIAVVYLLATFGCALLGVWLRKVLPESHLTKESKDSIKIAIGLIATMSALVLGLITASAKASFDSVDTAIKQSAAQILALDRLLARYGVESNDIRTNMKAALEARIKLIWGEGSKDLGGLDPFRSGIGLKIEDLGNAIRALTPKNEMQKSLQTRATDLAEDLLAARWMIFAGSVPSVSIPFILILLFWLSVTFLSFGLFAPYNGTVLTAFFVCALSVASSIFLVLELDTPFQGMVHISPKPLQYAFTHLNQ